MLSYPRNLTQITLRCISLLMACCLLWGCAMSRLQQNSLFIQPGVTTREEVHAKLGTPYHVIHNEASETLIYVERARNPMKGAMTGSLMGITYTLVLAVASAPFTFGAGFLAVPIAAVLGAAGGAVVGTFMKIDTAQMYVEVGNDGKVIEIRKGLPKKYLAK